MASKRKPQFNFRSQKNLSPLSHQQHSPLKSDGNYRETPFTGKSTMQVTPSAESKSQLPNVRKNRWWQTWQFWGILLVLCSGGIGYGATSMLLKLPKTQSCSQVFWPVASASVRLYCAQNLADESTVPSLLKAIALVEELPQDHPLRKEIDRNIEKWATAILAIGETKFQEGNLEAAIAIAKQIPEDVEAHSLVESQIESWNEIWSEAAQNYKRVEDNLRKAQWSDAFSWAVRLSDSSNDYWATTKYTETIDKINVSQEETMTLDKAATQIGTGEIDALLEAIAKAQAIPEDSYQSENAQNILAQGKEKLLARIDGLIEEREWSQLQRITYRIPDVLELEDRVADWKIIANAGSSASLNTVLGLEDAIAEAQKLEPTSPLYDRGQQLIEGWTLEIDDVGHLMKAKELARGGNISAYNSAITEVSAIPSSNPRYSEAREQIALWRGEIQRIEDRPIIERARELALANDNMAWRRAIAEISLVSSSSPLYPEAQRFASTWQANIEREEDQPILDEAIAIANTGDWSRAIAIAQPISQGRALSEQASEKIAQWGGEIQAQRDLEEAKTLASRNNSDALAQAITVIRQIPDSTSVYYEVVPNVNSWSSEILDLARRASYRSLEDGIAIAQKVPSGTSSYPTARRLIEEWQTQLNPAPLIEKEGKSQSELQLQKTEKEN